MAGGNIVRGNGAAAAAAAATAAARAASLQRGADTAQQAGQAAARAALADRGLDCDDVHVDVDPSEFADRTPGAAVRTTVQCTLPLAKYAVPGLPGTMTITDVRVSPIDVFRERSTP